MRIRTVLALLVGLLAFPALAQTTPTPELGGSREIAFTAVKVGETQTDIYLLNVDTGEMRNLTNSPGDDFDPTWSPDGEWLSFLTETQPNSSSYSYNLLHVYSGKIQLLTTSTDWTIAPFWSLDSKQIFFIGDQEAREVLFEVGTDGISHPLITRNYIYSPSFSPDGKKILFVSENGIELFNVGDGSTVLLTDTSERYDGYNRDIVSSWSSDGSKIAFISNRDFGDLEIYVMNAYGGDLRRLTNNILAERGLMWSPDSEQIYFIADSEGHKNSSLGTVKVNGTDFQILVENEFLYQSAALSPDGKFFVVADFLEIGKTGMGLYLLDNNGNEVQRLTDCTFFSIPKISWRPVPAAGE